MSDITSRTVDGVELPENNLMPEDVFESEDGLLMTADEAESLGGADVLAFPEPNTEGAAEDFSLAVFKKPEPYIEALGYQLPIEMAIKLHAELTEALRVAAAS
jgi:hypothetical protein